MRWGSGPGTRPRTHPKFNIHPGKFPRRLFPKRTGEGSLGPDRWSRSLAIALFLFAWGILSWPWLSGAVTIPYDAKALFQAELQFLANAIHQGQSPFWSPNVFGGMILQDAGAKAAPLAA